MRKFYITTPIYYASGDPHIGHSFATIYADAIARYNRLKNRQTFFSTGMDEHGSKIAEKAAEKNIAPKQFVDEIAAKYRKLWNALDIKYDGFIQTTSEKHIEGVKAFFERLRASGDVYENFYDGLYCIGCEDFITESKLANGLCPDHLTQPQAIQEKNYFFRLKRYLPVIREKIANDELKIIPETRKNEILGIIDSGIPDFSMTRNRDRVSWGIPYFYDESQTIYVWGDALINYITILDFPDGENFKTFWPADIHLVGAEISKFHAIYWPGMLLSAGLPLPKQIFIHGLFTVNGQKMSKTVGNIVDPWNLIPKFGADGTRYLLLSQFPGSEHGDIKAEEFETKYNSDLANGIGNLLERVYNMIKNYGIKIKEGTINGEIKNTAGKIREDYEINMENLNLFEALRIIFSFAKTLDRYVNEKEPWTLAKNGKSDELNTVLNSLFYGINGILEWLSPFMPEKTAIAQKFATDLKNGDLPKDAKLNLFPRI